MTQTFVEGCVDFEVAHLSVLMVQRLAYLEIPTLKQFWRGLYFTSELRADFFFERSHSH